MQDEVARQRRRRIEGGEAQRVPTHSEDRELAAVESELTMPKRCVERPPPLAPPPHGAGQSSPPDGLGARRLWPGPSQQRAGEFDRVKGTQAGLRPPLTRPNSPDAAHPQG